MATNFAICACTAKRTILKYFRPDKLSLYRKKWERHMVSFGFTKESLYPDLRAGLKRFAHQHPMLLSTVRNVRSFLRNEPKAPKLMPGYAPLCIDEKKLNDLGKISPTARDMILAEFAEISRVLNGVDTGFGDPARQLLQHPLDDLLSSAAELNLAYTPGKVGSCTAAATLEGLSCVRSPVPVVHFLSSKGHAYVERVSEKISRWPQAIGNWREGMLWSRMLRLRVMLNRLLRAEGGRLGAAMRKPILITGVREPVGIHLSCCFYAWWKHADTPEGITTKVVHELLARDPWHLQCDNWFNDELKEMFGLDVYARPFPFQRGWDIYENDRARVLLIRQENLASLAEGIGALYSLDPNIVKVVSTNVAAEKSYANSYDVVKKGLKLTERELDEIYSLRYVKHFYTSDEIAAFKERWGQVRIKPTPAVPTVHKAA
jgi:hypothetical protein